MVSENKGGGGWKVEEDGDEGGGRGVTTRDR